MEDTVQENSKNVQSANFDTPKEVLNQISIFYRSTLIASVLFMIAGLSSQSDRIGKMKKAIIILDSVLANETRVSSYENKANLEFKKFKEQSSVNVGSIIVHSRPKKGKVIDDNELLSNPTLESSRNPSFSLLIRDLKTILNPLPALYEMYDTSSRFSTFKYIDTSEIKRVLRLEICNDRQHVNWGKYITVDSVKNMYPVSPDSAIIFCKINCRRENSKNNKSGSLHDIKGKEYTKNEKFKVRVNKARFGVANIYGFLENTHKDSPIKNYDDCYHFLELYGAILNSKNYKESTWKNLVSEASIGNKLITIYEVEISESSFGIMVFLVLFLLEIPITLYLLYFLIHYKDLLVQDPKYFSGHSPILMFDNGIPSLLYTFFCMVVIPAYSLCSTIQNFSLPFIFGEHGLPYSMGDWFLVIFLILLFISSFLLVVVVRSYLYGSSHPVYRRLKSYFEDVISRITSSASNIKVKDSPDTEINT